MRKVKTGNSVVGINSLLELSAHATSNAMMKYFDLSLRKLDSTDLYYIIFHVLSMF